MCDVPSVHPLCKGSEHAAAICLCPQCVIDWRDSVDLDKEGDVHGSDGVEWSLCVRAVPTMSPSEGLTMVTVVIEDVPSVYVLGMFCQSVMSPLCPLMMSLLL